MGFLFDLTKELVDNLDNAYSSDNNDADRFGALSIKSRIAGIGEKWASKFGLVHVPTTRASELLAAIEPKIKELEELYVLLEDRASKDLLVKVFTYRALGFRKVKLPVNNEKYWKHMSKIRRFFDKSDSIKINFSDWSLSKAEVSDGGSPIQLYATPLGIMQIFYLRQYEYDNDKFRVAAEPGDVVVDLGGCYGETALYLANCVGESGRVYVFEFIPSNLDLLQKNLDLNPSLKDRIEPVNHPVWSQSDLSLHYQDMGPASKIVAADNPKQHGEAKTLTIDDLVARNNIQMVNFIKMDIEGAETEALKGAAQTIRQFKPKMAVSVYHRLDDFTEVPKIVRSISPDYKVFLKHCTIHGEETVMFFLPSE